MRLLLSSKGLIHEELPEAFLSFVKPKKTVAIITTASQDYKEKNRNTIKLTSKLIELGFTVKYVDIEFEDPARLAESEIIIVCGGNPYYLMYHLKKSNSEKIISDLITEQVPIWGISAGLMILMKDLGIIDLLTPEMNHIGLTDKKCLGIIDEIVIPHYDRFIKEGKILKDEIDRYETESGRRIIRMGEYQYLRYDANSFDLKGQLMM